MGTVTNNGSSLTYVPDENYNGPDELLITAYDKKGNSITRTLDIFVKHKNDIPYTFDAKAETIQNQPVIIDLLVLSSDVDLIKSLNMDSSYREYLYIFKDGFENVKNAEIEITEDRLSIIYTPKKEFFGQDTFIYTIIDQSGYIAKANVVVDVEEDLALTEESQQRITTSTVGGMTLQINSPEALEKHKDGDVIEVKWEIINIENEMNFKYELFFFDGANWLSIVKDWEDTTYQYTLPETNVEIDIAKFKVIATEDEKNLELIETSNEFIIDNIAPRDVLYTVNAEEDENGLIYFDENLSISVIGGYDLTKITYLFSLDDGQTMIEYDEFELPESDSILGIYAEDELNNRVLVKELTLKRKEKSQEINNSGESDNKKNNQITKILIIGSAFLSSSSLFWLLFFLLRRNIIIELYSNGELIKTLKFYCSPNSEEISVLVDDNDLQDADSGLIKIKKGLVRKIRTKNVLIINSEDILISEHKVPHNQEDIFIDDIRVK